MAGACLSLCVCVGAPGCRSPTPFRRATPRQRCGSSSVWAMPSCSVRLSSSWGACFSWPLPCFSWMTGRRPRNSKWLRHCWNNSSLFHLLFSHLFFKYLRLAWDVLHWLKNPNTPPQCKSLKKWQKYWFYSECPTQRVLTLYLDNAVLINPVAGVCVRDKLPSDANKGANPARLKKALEPIERPSQLKLLQSWHKLF